MQITTPWTAPKWDAWVTSHRHASFFHTSAWAKTLAETYGYRPVYLVEGESGQWKSLLPLMKVDSWLTGRRGIALPFTDECEPVAEDDSAVQRLFQESIKLGKELGWKYMELRGGRQRLKGVPASISFYAHLLDLSPGETVVFNSVETAIRKGIRKAEKEEVTVEISQTLESMKLFYGLQCKTRRRHGLPPQPFNFFLNIYRYILSQNLGMISLAKHRGQTVAGAVYFYIGTRAVYKFGASDYAWQQLRPNNLVMWTAIKWLIQKGATVLHFGKTSLKHDGLRRFKLSWGAREEMIDYIRYDLKKDEFTTEEDAVAGWHNRVFRAMPLNCSRLAGRLLYKHWA